MYRIHHAPRGEVVVTQFDVSVNGEKTFPWFCRVSAMPYNTVWPGLQRPIEQTETASFISFEMEEPVLLKVKPARAFDEVVIRPLSKKVQWEVKDGEILFTIEKPGAYTLELDGYHQPLHIFANPLIDFDVDINDPKVHYYGPGVHEVGNIELQDGETLFVDAGAVLYGSVCAIHKKNVRVLGYGVIDGSREERTSKTRLLAGTRDAAGDELTDEKTLRDFIKEKKVLNGCVHLYSCRNAEIKGIIARDSSTFAYIVADCDYVDCDGIKTIGMWRYNSDGIDLFNSRYVRIANGFFRDFDDCIVLKGIDGWADKDQHHITVSGCTVWCDWGSALEIGAETCAHEYHDILWEDCCVIHAAHVFMRTHNTDRAYVHDMILRNIHCEYSKYDMECAYQSDMTVFFDEVKKPGHAELICSPIYDGPYSNDHILGKTARIRYENIMVYGPEDMPAPVCEFVGQDEEHCNKNIVIKNVSINGKRVGAQALNIRKGPFDEVIVG